MEVQYVGWTAAANQTIWLSKMLVYLHQTQEGPTDLFVDN